MEPFDLSDYNSAYLQFWTGSFLRDNDIGTIQISGDGSIWESVYSISGINFEDTVKIDVTEYIESDVHLRFHISTDASEVASGWYVDDIHLLVDTSLVILSSDYEKNIPINFYLSQNYPNPFNPITSIDFFVTKKQKIQIVFVDVLGFTKRRRRLEFEQRVALDFLNAPGRPNDRMSEIDFFRGL